MTRFKANMLMTLAALIWGTTFVVQRTSMEAMGPFTFTGIRFLLGGLLLLPLAWPQRHRLIAADRGRDLPLLLLVGLALFAGSALQQIGLIYTTASNAGFLTILYVPLVPVLGFLAFRTLPHPLIWPAGLGSVIGAWLLSGAGTVEINPGDFWVLGSSFFWAIHVLSIGMAASRINAPLLIACVQFMITGTLSLIVALFIEEPDLTAIANAWFEIFYAGALSVAVAFTLQVVAQKYTMAADAAIILSTETLFAAIAGAIFLGERLTPVQLAGCALIFAGILAIQLLPLFTLKRRRKAL